MSRGKIYKLPFNLKLNNIACGFHILYNSWRTINSSNKNQIEWQNTWNAIFPNIHELIKTFLRIYLLKSWPTVRFIIPCRYSVNTVHCITVGNYETGCTPSKWKFSKDNYSSFPLFVFCNRFHIFVRIVRLSSMIPGISWKRYLSYLQMISYKRYLECTLVQ